MSKYLRNVLFHFAAGVYLMPAIAFSHAQLLSKAEQDLMSIDSPIPRVDSDDVKNSQPCGPDGGKKAPTNFYVKGSTIQVHWKETINHTGVFRIDFSSDGDQTFTPLINDVVDPQDTGVSRATPKMYMVNVTLPDIVCDNCTLRLTQSMGAIDDNSDYFSCSDIRLVASAADLPPRTGGNETTQSSESQPVKELAKFDAKPFSCGFMRNDHGMAPGGTPGTAGAIILLLLPLIATLGLRRSGTP